MRETKGHASVLKLGSVIGITLLGVTGGAGILIASSGGEDEVVQQVRTTRSAGTVATEAAASSTAPVVPENWLAYADPQGLYSFSYPSSWHVGTGGQRSVILTSWDTATWMSPQFPSNSIKVDVIVAPIEQAEAKPDGATPSSHLAGSQGWEIVYIYDPSATGGVTRAHEIAADHGSYRYFVTGLFAQDHPDEATLVAIAASFTFGQ